MTTIFALRQRLNKYPYNDRLRILAVYQDRLQIMLDRDDHPEAAVWIGPMQVEVDNHIEALQSSQLKRSNKYRVGYGIAL